MSLNFADVTGKAMDEIERPALPPVGTYRWRITKPPEQDTVGADDAWDVVNFSVQGIEAMDNVDMDDYKGDVTGIIQRLSFMFDKNDEAKFEQTLFRLRTFLQKHLGIEEPSLAEALNATVGCEFLGDIAWKQDKMDEELFHANLTKTAPLD